MSSLNTGVLKESRGFLRVVQCLTAFIAFIFVCNFSVNLEYDVLCMKNNLSTHVVHKFSYPFNLGYKNNQTVGCNNSTKKNESELLIFNQSPPGDVSGDAQFYVAVGVIGFLTAICMLYVYVCMSEWYYREDGKPAMYDLIVTALMSIFFVASTAAWMAGLGTIKTVTRGNWLIQDRDSACYILDENNSSDVTAVCQNITQVGSFGAANAASVFGLLNVFIWASSLLFVYKETTWYGGAGRSARSAGAERLASPDSLVTEPVEP